MNLSFGCGKQWNHRIPHSDWNNMLHVSGDNPCGLGERIQGKDKYTGEGIAEYEIHT